MPGRGHRRGRVRHHADVLVVGGSVAGLRTAEGLRRLSYPGAVTILEAGDDLPYDRTALSKKILSPDGEAASISLRSRGDFDRLGIYVRMDSRAESLDLARHVVQVADGTEFEYSVLVIATGSRAVELPFISRTTAHYLRTLADARRLRKAMDSTRRAVVVGAGFIGSEVAAAISARGTQVTLVEPGGFPLCRVLGEVIGERLAQLHESRGVRFVPHRSVTGVHANPSGLLPYNVALDDGSYMHSDLVVAGVGACPNTEWLDGSGVEVASGVVCDEFCRTGTPEVFAAGDVARWPNSLFGETMRVDHWTNAIEQAVVVAWNIANPDRPRGYAPVPYVWSDQHGLRLQIVGWPRPDDEVRIVEDDPANAVLVALYARRDRLSGAFTLNAPNRAVALRRLIATRGTFSQALGVEA
jgi:NADPH-dependent 2,4-dienoyl-CoA reductase/sulfur reductase-like enzyme